MNTKFSLFLKLLSTYHVLDTVLSPLCGLGHSIPQQLWEAGTPVYPHFTDGQMDALKDYGKVTSQLTACHRWQRQDLKLCSVAPESRVLTSTVKYSLNFEDLMLPPERPVYR